MSESNPNILETEIGYFGINPIPPDMLEPILKWYRANKTNQAGIILAKKTTHADTGETYYRYVNSLNLPRTFNDPTEQEDPRIFLTLGHMVNLIRRDDNFKDFEPHFWCMKGFNPNLKYVGIKGQFPGCPTQ
jgi:hypothetical protein